MKKHFNPLTLRIKDYTTPIAYKEDFFQKNILNTIEYFELWGFQPYFTFPFLCMSHIFKVSKTLSSNNKSEITYRKVNDWGVKGLFEDNRTTDIQWRKYSVRTGVQLLLINDLKKYGYSNDQIKYICQQIIEDSCSVLTENRKLNYRYFDFYASTFFKRGVSFSILIDNDCNSYILCDKDLVANIADGIDKEKPFLVLPLSKYLSVFTPYIFSIKNDRAITGELSAIKEIPSDNEQKILGKVRDEEVQEIKIIKKSKQKKSLIMKSKINKDNEYLTDKELASLVKGNKFAKTTASNVGGGFYNLSIEETEKLT